MNELEDKKYKPRFFLAEEALEKIPIAAHACMQVWNVFRMEWEQYHNIGEWRAVKSVSTELSDSMLLSHKVSLTHYFSQST